MNDTDLERRLRDDASHTRAAAPPLRHYLDRVDSDVERRGVRPSVRWLAVAATVLVVAGLAIGASLHRSDHRGSTTTSERSVGRSGPVSTITRNGAVLLYESTEEWSDPLLDDKDPSLVYVYASQQSSGRCGPDPLASRVVSETATAVTVAVDVYAPPPTANASRTGVFCGDVGYSPAQLAVTLTAPLGRRQLIDAMSGRAVPVVDGALVPAPPRSPLGFTGGEVVRGLLGYVRSDLAERVYRHEGGATIAIGVGSSARVRSEGHVVSRPDINGWAGIVSYSRGFARDIMVSWVVGNHEIHVYQVSSYTAGDGSLTADQLVAFARSLR